MKIVSNLAMSIDGKIATTNRAPFPLGTPLDRKRMKRLRSRFDAVLMGASSLRTFQKPLTTEGKKSAINVILSRNLHGVSPQWPFFREKKIRRILLLTEKISKKREQEFLKTSEIVYLKKANLTSQIQKELKKKGIRSLIVEGGGDLMWTFVQKDLIQEYYLTLTPRILGGAAAPTLVDGQGFSPHRSLKLKLKRVEKVRDELYLVYA